MLDPEMIRDSMTAKQANELYEETIDKIKSKLEKLDVKSKAYPNYQVFPPNCTFIPSKELIRMFIKGLLKYGHKEDHEVTLLRFGFNTYPEIELNEEEAEPKTLVTEHKEEPVLDE
jgi:hypothetical protein